VSELPTGAYAPGYSSGDDPSKAKQVAGQTKEAAAQVKGTAAEQAQRVGAEARTQARNVAADVRDRLGEQARSQNSRLVGSIRQTADHLDEMRGDRSGSPAATVVSRIADGGRQLADYLDRNGPDGVLREVQEFARRRPGAFLATALAAGFVVGRLGKSIAQADPTAGTAGKPASDTYASEYRRTAPDAEYVTPIPAPTVGTGAAYTGTEYATGTAGTGTAGTGSGGGTTGSGVAGTGATSTPGTGYAATGTGTPVVVEDGDYPPTGPEPRP
jgi:hypothetical protein